MRRQIFLATLWAGLATCVPAVGAVPTATRPAATPAAAQPAATQPAEAWAKLPPARWPQLVLTNEATFNGHAPLHGASAFLVRMPGGVVAVGTAKHLIGEAGGVEPPVTLADLDQALTGWRAFPRTRPKAAVEAKGRAVTPNGEGRHDWLLLNLSDPKAALPATPLVPRLRPAAVGETVYLVGVSYADRGAVQNVYKGTVTARPSKHYFEYEFAPPVRIAGFSGAPIVDADGLLVGHGVNRSANPKQVNGKEVQFGGEDADLALSLWQHRADRPTPPPTEALHLALPPGWAGRPPPKADAILTYAVRADLNAGFEMTAVPRANFDDDVDLAAWGALSQARSAKASKLAHRADTSLVRGRIGGRPTAEYEVAGDLGASALRYRIVMLEVNGYYCKLTFWTVPNNWDAALPAFEAVVEALK
ncbi:MAG: hypothetical protein JWO31_1440 [Phycisphaerales bacterium]|nr:hypothetical protein [Phycisphaerales bacterium]